MSDPIFVNPSALPPLTVLEEFLILTHDDRASQFYPLARSALDAATAGAMLMDLALRQRVDNDLRHFFVIDPTPVNDDLLDPVLQTVALAPVIHPLSASHWVAQLAPESPALRERAIQRLEARGILRREAKKVLWIFTAATYPIAFESEVHEVRQRLRGVILGDALPLPHDIMLIALAEACGLFPHMFNHKELEKVSARIEHVARMDLIGQAVAQAVTEIETAIAMASGFR